MGLRDVAVESWGFGPNPSLILTSPDLAFEAMGAFGSSGPQ